MTNHKRLYEWFKVPANGFMPNEKITDYTHLDLSGGCSAIRVDASAATGKTLFRLYAEDISNGVPHFLSEVADPTRFRAYLDLDLKFKLGVLVSTNFYFQVATGRKLSFLITVLVF